MSPESGNRMFGATLARQEIEQLQESIQNTRRGE
jgi:hypothetical protein